MTDTLTCLPWFILPVVLLVLAAFVAAGAREMSRGRVEVSKTQDNEYVKIVISNRTRTPLEDVIVEKYQNFVAADRWARPLGP